MLDIPQRRHRKVDERMKKLQLALLRLRANYIGPLWRIGLIKRTTAFKWDVDVAVFDTTSEPSAQE